jgi:hypothetical protein
MAASVQPKLALAYHDDAHVEPGGNAVGLMGRQVAGKAFLEAYLSQVRISRPTNTSPSEGVHREENPD